MAKLFYRLQRFLRRTQFVFLFLAAAYLMAGSVVLLQRSGFALQAGSRGTSSFLPVPSLGTLTKGAVLDSGMVVSGNKLDSQALVSRLDGPLNGEVLGRRNGPRWLTSRNLEIRQLRRRWFHSLMTEQEPRVERKVVKRKVKHKGKTNKQQRLTLILKTCHPVLQTVRVFMNCSAFDLVLFRVGPILCRITWVF